MVNRQAQPQSRVACLLPEEIGQIRELIAGKHSKSALQLAKDLYKRSATAESEALLTDAYRRASTTCSGWE